jgi:Tfp pilus assembly protein PilX
VENNRGVALILALLVLSFLTVLGGALLTTSTIDIWISDNYKSATQSLYLAEAGIDHGREVLLTSGRTLTDLLNASAGLDRLLLTDDDQPLIPSRRFTGTGPGPGSYQVWLRNDVADGIASLNDTNDVVTLVSEGQIGRARKTIEVTVQKGKFPETNADPRLGTISGLEGLANSISRNATDVYKLAAMTGVGSASDYRVIVVDGNLDIGPGTGYGLLLVRGELNIVANITWNGLIAVIGQGVVRTASSVTATINGGLFKARTRAPTGTLLAVPEDMTYTITDTTQLKAANRPFPFNAIAIREK